MIIENDFTVYEKGDSSNLADYSQKHAEEIKSRFIKCENDINNIKEEQKIQNNNINTALKDVETLQKESKRLQKLLEEERHRNDMQESTMLFDAKTGTNIHIEDSTDYYFKKLNILGNLKEERYWSKRLEK